MNNQNTRTVTLPAGKAKGKTNARPMLHPNYADALIELATRVSILDSEDLRKVAVYVHKLGLYLKTPEYHRAKSYRLASKERHKARLKGGGK